MSSLPLLRARLPIEDRSSLGRGDDRIAADRVARDAAISATLLTKGSARRLPQVSNALRWCDEVVVLDTSGCLAQAPPDRSMPANISPSTSCSIRCNTCSIATRGDHAEGLVGCPCDDEPAAPHVCDLERWPRAWSLAMASTL
jgi:hypothetical protein